MYFLYTLLLMLGLFLFISGLGFTLNFLGFMIRATALGWKEFFYLTVLASTLLVAGSILLIRYIPLTIALFAQEA